MLISVRDLPSKFEESCCLASGCSSTLVRERCNLLIAKKLEIMNRMQLKFACFLVRQRQRSRHPTSRKYPDCSTSFHVYLVAIGSSILPIGNQFFFHNTNFNSVLFCFSYAAQTLDITNLQFVSPDRR